MRGRIPMRKGVYVRLREVECHNRTVERDRAKRSGESLIVPPSQDPLQALNLAGTAKTRELLLFLRRLEFRVVQRDVTLDSCDRVCGRLAIHVPDGLERNFHAVGVAIVGVVRLNLQGAEHSAVANQAPDKQAGLLVEK